MKEVVVEQILPGAQRQIQLTELDGQVSAEQASNTQTGELTQPCWTTHEVSKHLTQVRRLLAGDIHQRHAGDFITVDGRGPWGWGPQS